MRGDILSDSGYEAISPESQMDAMLAVHAVRFEVLLLCDQSDLEIADQLCKYFRAANPDSRIVLIQSIGRELPCAKADAIVDAHNPRALVNAICSQEQEHVRRNR
jgi:hypothetical protein